MPNPLMNIGQPSGGPGMAPMTQSPQPQQGPTGMPQIMRGAAQAQAPQPGQFGVPQTPMPGQNFGQPQGAAAARRFRETVGRLENSLRQARLAGAPPSIISNLESELAQAQEEMRMAGMQQMYNQQMESLNRGIGGGSVGSSAPSPYASQWRGRDALMNQMIAAMFGMGYGPASGGPMG